MPALSMPPSPFKRRKDLNRSEYLTKEAITQGINELHSKLDKPLDESERASSPEAKRIHDLIAKASPKVLRKVVEEAAKKPKSPVIDAFFTGEFSLSDRLKPHSPIMSRSPSFDDLYAAALQAKKPEQEEEEQQLHPMIAARNKIEEEIKQIKLSRRAKLKCLLLWRSRKSERKRRYFNKLTNPIKTPDNKINFAALEKIDTPIILVITADPNYSKPFMGSFSKGQQKSIKQLRPSVCNKYFKDHVLPKKGTERSLEHLGGVPRENPNNGPVSLNSPLHTSRHTEEPPSPELDDPYRLGEKLRNADVTATDGNTPPPVYQNQELSTSAAVTATLNVPGNMDHEEEMHLMQKQKIPYVLLPFSSPKNQQPQINIVELLDTTLSEAEKELQEKGCINNTITTQPKITFPEDKRRELATRNMQGTSIDVAPAVTDPITDAYQRAAQLQAAIAQAKEEAGLDAQHQDYKYENQLCRGVLIASFTELFQSWNQLSQARINKLLNTITQNIILLATHLGVVTPYSNNLDVQMEDLLKTVLNEHDYYTLLGQESATILDNALLVTRDTNTNQEVETNAKHIALLLLYAAYADLKLGGKHTYLPALNETINKIIYPQDESLMSPPFDASQASIKRPGSPGALAPQVPTTPQTASPGAKAKPVTSPGTQAHKRTLSDPSLMSTPEFKTQDSDRRRHSLSNLNGSFTGSHFQDDESLLEEVTDVSLGAIAADSFTSPGAQAAPVDFTDDYSPGAAADPQYSFNTSFTGKVQIPSFQPADEELDPECDLGPEENDCDHDEFSMFEQ